MRRHGEITGKSFDEWVVDRLHHLTTTHGFDYDGGTAQVRGKDEATQRAFGEWDMLRTVAREFGIGGVRR